LIRGRGARLDDQAIPIETRSVTLSDIGANDLIKRSADEKRHALVKAG